jgi:hypothetical protein
VNSTSVSADEHSRKCSRFGGDYADHPKLMAACCDIKLMYISDFIAFPKNNPGCIENKTMIHVIYNGM